MQKKKPKQKPKHKPGHRNSGGGAAIARPAASRPRRRALHRAPAPELNTTIASIAGGGGGALLGGLLASQDVMSPESIGLAMTIGGGIAAFTMDGNARVAANGLAAAGAGQLALALMASRTEAAAKAKKDEAGPADPPPRQGVGPARVWRRYQHESADVDRDLGFVEDDDGYDDVA